MSDQEELQRLSQRATELHQRKRALLQAAMTGSIDFTEFNRDTAPIDTELDHIQQRIVQMARTQNDARWDAIDNDYQRLQQVVTDNIPTDHPAHRELLAILDQARLTARDNREQRDALWDDDSDDENPSEN